MGYCQAQGIRNIPESPSNCKVYKTATFLRTVRPGGGSAGQFLAAVMALLCSLHLVVPSSGWAQSAVPAYDAGAYHLYLVPDQEIQGLDFLTHIVEIQVQQDSPSRTTFATVATYRWHNTQAESRSLQLRVRSRHGTIGNPVHGQLLHFAVYRGNEALPLVPLDSGQYHTEVHLDPGQRLNLELRYAVQSPALYFPRVAYDMALLRRWWHVPDSTRISIFPGFAPQADNVLMPFPLDYELRADEVRWLYEEALPTQTPEAHLLHRDVWESLQAALQNDDHITLGQHYHILYMAADAPHSHQRMYYDLALAAFLQALDQDPGQAHYGLARLYRMQTVPGTPSLHVSYLELALHHAQMALQTLDPEATAQRKDVVRWLWQLLEMRVNLSAQYEDWETVNQDLEAIAALLVEGADTARLANLQRYAHTQQAIRLLEQGMTDQALRLVGPDILDPYYMPASHLVPLFTGWHADIRIGPDSFTAHLEGTIDTRQQDRIGDAVTTLEALLAQGEAGVQTTLVLASAQERTPAAPVLILDLHITNPQHAHNLADLLPSNSEWNLVRYLLQGSRLYMSPTRNPLFEERVYEYSLDLTELYQLWEAKALALEETAVAEASIGTNSQEEAIRQVNFLNSAHDWRNLAHNTTVLVALVNSTGRPGAAQAQWAATQDQPTVQIRAATRRLRVPNLVLFSSLGLLLAVGISLFLVRLPGHRLQPSRISSPF